MGFASESGYTPASIQTILDAIMTEVNTQFGTSYTSETFIGTNFYKYAYAIAQRIQESEIKTSEIFNYLQQYFDETNERIQRPVATPGGVIEALAGAGYVASVKPIVEADAGTINVCVDVDDGDHASGNITITSYANLVSGTDDSVTVGATTFTAQVGAATPGATTFQAATSNAATATSLAAQINAHATAGALVRARAAGAIVYITAIQGGTAGNSIALGYTDNDTNVGATKSGTALAGGTANAEYADKKLAINTIISESVAAGIVSNGSEESTIVLSNGQSFDFAFHLPERIQPLLRLTLTLSENNQVVVGDPDDVKELLMTNIAARYSLGKNFEPQRYFAQSDAPWTSTVLLEYSLDAGATYVSTVYNADFDELFEIVLGNISIVEA